MQSICRVIQSCVTVLIFFGVATVASMSAFAAEGQNALDAFVQKTQNAQGRFTQTLYTNDPDTGVQTSEGNFLFDRVGHFVWNTEKPYPQRIMTTDTELWIWDPDLNQLTIKALSQALSATPMAILMGNNDIETHFNVRTVNAQEVSQQTQKNTTRTMLKTDETLQWVLVTPKEENISFAFFVLGFDSKHQIQEMRLVDHFENMTLLRFSDVRINQTLTADQFTFVPPKGAEILRDNSTP